MRWIARGTSTELDSAPWADERRGDGISPHRIANLLKPFDVRPHRGRITDGGQVRGYWLNDLEPVFDRYPPPEVSQCHKARNGAGSGDLRTVLERKAQDTSEAGENPHGYAVCDTKTVSEVGTIGGPRPATPQRDILAEAPEAWELGEGEPGHGPASAAQLNRLTALTAQLGPKASRWCAEQLAQGLTERQAYVLISEVCARVAGTTS